MKKGRSIHKGHAFERVVASMLTKAFYEAGDGECRRVPLSGGWDKRTVSGDVIALRYADGKSSLVIDSSFPFSVECKNYKDIRHFFVGLYSSDSELFSWMEQATEDAAPHRRMPLIIFKLFRSELVAVMNRTDFCKMEQIFGGFPGAIYGVSREVRPSTSDKTSASFVAVMLEKLLEWIDWDAIKMAARTQFIRSLVPRGE